MHIIGQWAEIWENWCLRIWLVCLGTGRMRESVYKRGFSYEAIPSICMWANPKEELNPENWFLFFFPPMIYFLLSIQWLRWGGHETLKIWVVYTEFSIKFLLSLLILIRQTYLNEENLSISQSWVNVSPNTEKAFSYAGSSFHWAPILPYCTVLLFWAAEYTGKHP